MSKCSPQHSVLKHCEPDNLYSSLRVGDCVTHTYKITGKIIVTHFNTDFLDSRLERKRTGLSKTLKADFTQWKALCS